MTVALCLHHKRQERHEDEARKLDEHRHNLHAFHRRDQGCRQLAANKFLFVSIQPTRRCGIVDGERWLVEYHALQGRSDSRGSQRRERPASGRRCSAPSFGDEFLHVFDLLVYGEPVAMRTAQAATAPVNHIQCISVDNAAANFMKSFEVFIPPWSKMTAAPFPRRR